MIGSSVYEGQFEDGQRQGYGRLIYLSDVKEGQFDDKAMLEVSNIREPQYLKKERL